MKKHYFLNALFLLLVNLVYAQAPQAICYQAAAIDADGNDIAGQGISIRATVHKDAPNGPAQWIEAHSPGTDQFGLFAINIGQGAYLGGALTQFDEIDWGNGTYYLKIEMDADGGQNYILMGTSQMISVPYALYANGANEANHAATADIAAVADVANSVVGDNDLDNTNEIQELVVQNGTIVLQTLDGTTTGDPITFLADGDTSAMNEIQDLIVQNDQLFLINPDGTINGDGVGFDDSNTNEIQELVAQNGTLVLQTSDGTVTGDPITFLPDGDTSAMNELQDLVVQNGTLFLESPDGTITGNGFELPIDNDTSAVNEIQELEFENGLLSISGGNQISIIDPSFNATGSSSDFPQGIIGDHIVKTTGIYQVPDDKTFWITAGGPTVELLDVGDHPVLMHPTTPNMPVLHSGALVQNCMCTGILIDTSAVITPMVLDFADGNNLYVVPDGKILFIKSGLDNDKPAVLGINNVNMEFLRPSFTRGTRILSFPENTTIQAIPNVFGEIETILTGYLLDKAVFTLDPNGN